ncbi:hypothetical protein NCC49_003204 [Naganishia albida]|nr:hypothetical protein NCC49_003204 [Naganishia albida]
MSFFPSKLRLFLTAAVTLSSLYGPPIHQQLRVLGILSRDEPAGNVHGVDGQIRLIPGTIQCEDLHHHERSGLLFTACEGEGSARLGWFPPTGLFDDPHSVPTEAGKRGELVVVDPKTFKSTILNLENFVGAFVTHGIDIIDDPQDPSAIYIHAVNHAPTVPIPESKAPEDIVRSKIEIFRHVLGSSSARHIRSVHHPLVRTPNDIYSIGPGELLVTNDHKHRDGFLRHVEDVVSHALAPKTDIVHLDVDLVQGATTDDDDDERGAKATIAIDGLHNGNGLGHGPHGQVLLGDAAGGILHLGTLERSPSPRLLLQHRIRLDSTIDNPSYFASRDGTTSGYVLAGLSQAHTLAGNVRDARGKDPVIVWYVPRTETGVERPRVLFKDDSSVLRSASAAVIVEDETGDKWLFVTGFLSHAMVAVKVEL